MTHDTTTTRLWLTTLLILLSFSRLESQTNCNLHCYQYWVDGGYALRWITSAVTYRINNTMAIGTLTQQDWENAINAASQTWNTAGSRFVFSVGSTTVKNYLPAGRDTQNVYGWLIDAARPAGFTRLTARANEAFVELDSYFNQHSMYQWSRNPTGSQLDIQTVALHEFGHWAGLEHQGPINSNIACSPGAECDDNSMWYVYPAGTNTRRALTSDDKFGVQSIYPFLRSNATISQHITRFEQWSGNITLTNDPHITCGVTVVMTGGTLIIPSGRRLYVDDHATLTLNAGVICQATGAELIVRPCGRYNNNAGCNIRGETGCLMVEGIYELGAGLTQQFLDDGFLALNGGEIILGQGSSIVIENSGNSRMEVRQNSTISYGSGSSVTVNGRVDVWDDAQFSIPPNGIVNANAGSFFSMGSGASIYTEGKFHAVGSASNKIQFTSTAGWNGISAQNGNLTTSADLRLEHVEISGANRGVHIKTPMYATITNTTISGVTDMGIEIVPNLSNGGGPNQDVLLDHVAISTNDAYGISALQSVEI